MGNAGIAGNYKANFGGTSAACPVVAGVAALVLSINPALSPQEVKNILTASAIDMGANGFDNEFGFGRVNAVEAIRMTLSESMNGPKLVCNNAQGTYTFSNVPTGVSITWSKSSNLTIMSGQGTNSLTVKGMTFGNYGSQGWVKATLSSSCGTLPLEEYDVWVGPPGGPITNPSGVPAIVASLSSYVTINVTDVPGTFGSYNLNWWTNDPTSLGLAPGGNVCVVECLKTGYNYVYVTGTNSCGEGIYRQIPIDVTSGGGGGGICCPHPQIVINPNPSSEQINITFSNKEELEEYYGDSDMIYHIVITDMTGHSKYRGTLNKNGLKVNLKHAKEGIYLVKVYNKDGESTSRLIIE
jgi:hypothetical protein